MQLSNPNITFVFTEDSTTTTVTASGIIARSVTFYNKLLNGLFSSSNQVTLSLHRDESVIEKLIATDNDVKAVLKDGDTILFTGYVSTNFSWVVTTNGEQALDITIEDVGTRLLTKNFITSGYFTFATTLQSAVQTICTVAKVTISSSVVFPTHNVVKSISDSVTCKELLDSLLSEFNLVYYFNNLGELCLYEVKCTTTTGAEVFDKDSIYSVGGTGVSLRKSIRQYKNARISYSEIGTASDYIVYRNTTKDTDGGKFCNMSLSAGQHFDGTEKYIPSGDLRTPAYIEAVNATSENKIVGAKEILAISNPTPVIDTQGGTLTMTVSAAGGKYLTIDAVNSGYATGYFKQMDIKANIAYAKSVNIIRTTNTVGSNSSDALLDEELTWTHEKSVATKRANLVAQYYANAGSEYSFYSTKKVALGSICRLHEDSISGLDVYILLIASTETDESDVIQYTGVGISVFDLTKTVTELKNVPGYEISADLYDIAVEKGFEGSIEEFVTEITTPVELPSFLGVVSNVPDITQYNDGDYFVVGATDIISVDKTYPAGSTWKKEGESWVSDKDANNLLISLNALVKDETIDLRAISNANTVSFFKTIIGQESIFDSIFGNNVQVGNSIYGGDVDVSTWDINEGGKGFILLADGKLKAKQAELEDITVSGESELKDVTINGNSEFNGKGVFRGKISAIALETFDSSPEIAFYSLSTSKSPVAGVTYYSDRNGTVYTETVTNPKEQGLYINSIDSSKCTKQQWENIEGILEDTQYSDKTKLSKVYANSALYHNGVWIEVGSKAAFNWDGVISRSTNGIDFEVVMEIKGSITNSQKFHSVGVLNNTMFALQKMTYVYISNDNGITWSKASDLPYEVPAFGAATVINGAVYVACSNKCIYKTTDFSSWQQVNVFDSYPLRVGYNGSEFVVIMSNGNIHFYNDLSSTPTFISYSEPPEETVSLTYSFLYGDKFVIPTTKQYFIGHEKYEFGYASAMSSAEYRGKLYFSTGVSLFEASNDLQSIKVVNSGFIGNSYRAVITDGNKLVWPSNVDNNGIFIIEPKWKCKPIIEFLNNIKQKLSEDYIKSLPEGITFEDFSEPLQYKTPCTGILHYDNRQYNFSEAFCDGQQLTVYGSSFGEFTIKSLNFSDIKCYLENLIILEIEENVITKSIIPNGTGSYDIGSNARRFEDGYFNNIDSNVNSAGTSNKVYGAVFN